MANPALRKRRPVNEQPEEPLPNAIKVPLWPVVVVYSTLDAVPPPGMVDWQISTMILLLPSQSNGLARVKRLKPLIGLKGTGPRTVVVGWNPPATVRLVNPVAH